MASPRRPTPRPAPPLTERAPAYSGASGARGGRGLSSGGGGPHAASPVRLNRSPAGCAQDEGVPLRRRAPPPPPPPARLHVRHSCAILAARYARGTRPVV